MRKIQLKINLGFAQFAFFLVSLPSDTGHAPSLRKYIFGAPIYPNPNEKVETRRAACRQQISTIPEENTIENQSWFCTICILSGISPFRHGARPVSTEIHLGTPIHHNPNEKVETRRAACRKQISTIIYEEHTIENQSWFCTICILSGVFPSRHGARPVSTEIHFWHADTPQSK